MLRIRLAGQKRLAYRLTRANQEIRRDVEAIALFNQASVPGTDVIAGVTGGLPADRDVSS